MSKAEMLASALSGGLQNKVSAAFDVDKEAATELRRLAAEVEQLTQERTAWQVTAENAEAALTLTDETATQLREQVAALDEAAMKDES